MDKIDQIIEACGEGYILDLLQEECAELIQAASKVKRLMKGEKQLSPLQVRANFVEELADVRLMIKCARRLLTSQEDIDMIVTETRKERRWTEERM